ncbi:MAG: bifunctional DNA primase/polymerase [Planctomycetes bacterium]|nr:bifunctional DNA primase/polymerase [Planctomycetota bacterium]
MRSSIAATELPYTDLVSAALFYARAGWRIFPIAEREKRPLTSHGFKDASKELPKIESWWTQWPNANIGFPTGADQGIVVLDVDPRNGGEASFDALGALGITIDRTWVSNTGGGGRHYFFRCPEGSTRSRTNFFGSGGLDWKGEGGYVILPPSIHSSGASYCWTEGRRPGLCDPSPCPPVLLEIVEHDGSRKAEERSSVRFGFATGDRNNQLFKTACYWISRGLSAEATRRFLLDLNRELCQPPLDEGEVLQISRSAARYRPMAEGAVGHGE